MERECVGHRTENRHESFFKVCVSRSRRRWDTIYFPEGRKGEGCVKITIGLKKFLKEDWKKGVAPIEVKADRSKTKLERKHSTTEEDNLEAASGVPLTRSPRRSLKGRRCAEGIGRITVHAIIRPFSIESHPLLHVRG